MKRATGRLLVAVLAVLSSGAAGAADILIVRSSRLAAYEAAVGSFQASLGRASPSGGPKQALPHTFTDLWLSDPDAPDAFARALRARRPDLVLAVGGPAAAALGDLEDVPVVHIFAPNPAALAAGRKNVAGIPFEVPPAASLDALLSAAPKVRRVGLVHDPRRTARFVAEAREAAGRKGIALEVREARSAQEVPGLLADLKGRVDALWMVPDLTVTTPETAEALVTLSLEARVPVLTFAEKYLDLGAALAVTVTPESVGEQAAAAARLLLAGMPPSQWRPKNGPQVKVRLNAAVARDLGLRFGGER